MIKLVLEDRRKPVVYTPPAPWKAPSPVVQPSVTNIAVYNEARRRDNIIKELLKEFKLVEGHIVLAVVSNQEYVINKICRSYVHMGSDVDWPASDNPMIVTITSTKDQSVCFCTTNYLKAKV
jgi:hypothetical protein